MRNEEIYTLLKEQKADLKELLEANSMATRATVKSEFTILGKDVKDLKDYQLKQNGRTSELEKDTKIFRLIHRNPRATGIFIALIILGINGKNIIDIVKTIF